MNEDDLARRIAGRLDQCLTELPPAVAGPLADIRRRALASRPAPSRAVRFGQWMTEHRLMVGVAVPALFLLMTASTIFLLQERAGQDPYDVESALLADELPIHAYTDPGFDSWLQHSSHEQQQ